jgi:excinuclease UvrABC nuclease subunit
MELTSDAAALVISEARRETAARFAVSVADQRRRDVQLIELLDVLVGVGPAGGVPA